MWIGLFFKYPTRDLYMTIHFSAILINIETMAQSLGVIAISQRSSLFRDILDIVLELIPFSSRADALFLHDRPGR
ncbi:hypothetical protein P691DRAFT_801251 [Macrolepiota fuliginosa MF-IS2]|uniref:Uncharacterized protein n=1 Tax=Macrolepiota fuliginosa MF-IS2 TaxID=1400762 RepID=A0A9P5WZQ0_9AGAR|nr:hypothetical protein P691DRAFT_801251 [Macrolepiota fuliginosa MF-IS2]